MAELAAEAARLLRMREKDILSLRLLRRSVDAREEVRLVYTVEVAVKEESAILRRARSRKISRAAQAPAYTPPSPLPAPAVPPVVVGAGPAGLFAALVLAQAGLRPILLERGRPVERRKADVERFWATGELDLTSNVQFGEGGAGAFSDGKLNTGTRDPRHRFILETLVSCGAPEDILIDAKPHVGTDYLHTVLVNLRRRLLELGTDIRFESWLADLDIRDGALRGITAEGPEGVYTLPCSHLLLCPGHSARDTFAMLHQAGVPMEQKNFAVGVRIEQEQAAISRAQYGPAWEQLPPSDYKLACHLPTGRSAFTFCVCPGGQVVASSSAPGQVVTNGMSLRARDGKNINGGFLVGVGPEDFCSFGSDPLAGVRFQEQWERAAFQLGGGNFLAPAQLVGDFLNKRPSQGPGSILPTYRPGVTWTELDRCLPQAVADTLRDALPLMDRKLRGFAASEGVLTGVETRSSSPVRILRDESLQSALRGLYPCGEGAGYAGGIVSAAVDGIRVAEAVARG